MFTLICSSSAIYVNSSSIVNHISFHRISKLTLLFWGTENASDGRYPTGSRNSYSVGSNTPLARRRSSLENASPSSTARKRSPLGSNVKKTSPGLFQKLDRKKPSDLKVEIVAAAGCYGVQVSDDKVEHVLETSEEEKKPFEIKRALFKESNGKHNKLGFFRGGSRVVPCGDTSVVVSNETRESDDLSLIRKQLLQIESQQSNLMDMLQVYSAFFHLYCLLIYLKILAKQ